MSVIWVAVAAAAAAATTTTTAVPGGMLKLHKRREGWRSLRRAQQSDKEFLFQREALKREVYRVLKSSNKNESPKE